MYIILLGFEGKTSLLYCAVICPHATERIGRRGRLPTPLESRGSNPIQDNNIFSNCQTLFMTKTPPNFGRRILWLSLFAIAMAYLESAVVVYLRVIYYPEGFQFPLEAITGTTLWIEVGREAATVVMLIIVGILIAVTGPGRFAVVCFTFGVWDIFYYIWLWIFIGWPPSLMTWDLLFLIPLPWIGQVITPILVSVCLITAGLIILYHESHNRRFHPPWWAWWFEIICGLLIIAAFLGNTLTVISQSVPESFPWLMFLLGLVGGMVLFLTMFRQPRYFQPINNTGHEHGHTN